MFRADIHIFKPDNDTRRMKWATIFATTLPGGSCINDIYLLYTGINHYDCILDAVFETRHLASLLDNESVANLNVGVSGKDSSVFVKRRKVRYQSIINGVLFSNFEMNLDVFIISY